MASVSQFTILSSRGDQILSKEVSEKTRNVVKESLAFIVSPRTNDLLLFSSFFLLSSFFFLLLSSFVVMFQKV